MAGTEKRVLVIINPISGTLPKDSIEERVLSKLVPSGFHVEFAETAHAGHGAQLADEASAEGYYAVIAAGGDGTVNEIASSVRGTNTIMGILPYGSGNGLARHLYTSIDVDHALDIIAKDNPLRCDYGIANGTPFFCTFGLGFDANVSHEFANASTRGLITYLKSVVTEYFKYNPGSYDIEAFDGKKIYRLSVKAFILAVCNASQYGNNAFIAPQASINDGLLDLVIVHQGNPLTRAIAGAELFTGSLDRNVLIETVNAKKITIRHMPGKAHIDGEPITVPETIEIECREGDLRLFADPDKPAFKPFITPIESIRDDSTYLIRENARLAAKNIKNVFKKK